MQRTPHSYTLREHWDSGKFDSVVRFIRQNGVVERFYRAKYIYYYLGDYKYWTMGNPINETKLINRAKHDTSYGFLRNKAIL